VSGPTLGPTKPPIPWGFSLGVKRPGLVADHSPSGAEVMNFGAIPPLPHTSLWRGAEISKQRHLYLHVKCSVLYKGGGLRLTVRVIRGRWCLTSASTYHSITCRAGKEYEREQGKLIQPVRKLG
jgi:hypothetical protein